MQKIEALEESGKTMEDKIHDALIPFQATMKKGFKYIQC
jgi:hypothetical protein